MEFRVDQPLFPVSAVWEKDGVRDIKVYFTAAEAEADVRSRVNQQWVVVSALDRVPRPIRFQFLRRWCLMEKWLTECVQDAIFMILLPPIVKIGEKGSVTWSWPE